MSNEEKPSLLQGLQEDRAEAEADLASALPEDFPSLGDPDALQPGESANPGVAVEQLLAEAMLDEALPESEPLGEEFYAAGAAFPPLFQVRLFPGSLEARIALKKALESQGIPFGEKALAAAEPVVSQLTEFQAVLLLRSAFTLGVSAESQPQWPVVFAASEEDLALGELSGVPDPAALAAVGAPSVSLPLGEKDVLLCTPDHLPSFPVQESLGVVAAHRSIVRRFFREDEVREKMGKELRGLSSRSGAALPSSQLQALLRELFLDLQKAALARGGNAVLGVKLEAFPETSNVDPQLEQLRLVAFGTAAVVEKS